MNLSIREARPSDILAVGERFKEMFDFHGQRDPHFTRTESGHEIFSNWFIKQIEEEGAAALIAEVDGKIVGYALGMLRHHLQAYAHRSYGDINDIVISSEYR